MDKTGGLSGRVLLDDNFRGMRRIASSDEELRESRPSCACAIVAMKRLLCVHTGNAVQLIKCGGNHALEVGKLGGALDAEYRIAGVKFAVAICSLILRIWDFVEACARVVAPV